MPHLPPPIQPNNSLLSLHCLLIVQRALTRHPTQRRHQALCTFFARSTFRGRPSWDRAQPSIKDHAWGTRSELRQYADSYSAPELLPALRDITYDALFETS